MFFTGTFSIEDSFLNAAQKPHDEHHPYDDDVVSRIAEDDIAIIMNDITAKDGFVANVGDTVTIDYTGTIDGKEFDGNQEQDAQVEIGAGFYVEANGKYKGFEEQLIGHKAGDNFSITVKFPDDYEQETDGESTLNNKVAVFKINMKKVQVLEKVEYNDEWVKKNSETGSKTKEEYKKEVRESLEKSMKEDVEAERKETIRSELREALQEEIEWVKKPEDEIKAQTDEYKKQAEEQAKTYGITLKEMCEANGYASEEEFYEMMEEDAEYSLMLEKAIALIADKEKIELSDKEYEKSLKEIAEQMGAESSEEFEEAYGADYIRSVLLEEKVLDYLAESAKFVKASEESTEELGESDYYDEDSEASSEVELDMDDLIVEDEEQ